LTTTFSASNDTNNNYLDSNNGAITGAVKDDDKNRIPDIPSHLQGLAAVEDSKGIKRKASALSRAEDTLGKFAYQTAASVTRQGWASFVNSVRGTSNVAAGVRRLPHKAARLLDHLRTKGATVLMANEPWTTADLDRAMHRGSHKSAHEERDFVFEEIMDFCTQGYWTVLPYDTVRDWRGLRLSPLGVVPQRDRRPRLIVDYSFSGVNEATIPLAPKEAMQFGRALQRVIQKIVNADPRYGPTYLAKIDIADGFYRVWLKITDIPKLGVMLPTTPGRPQLVAFPLALPMGWVESPPYFSVLTETACDLANEHLRRRPRERPRSSVHRLEAVAATPPPDTEVTGETTTRLPPRVRNGIRGHRRTPRGIHRQQ
jgi:hypothetical protein